MGVQTLSPRLTLRAINRRYLRAIQDPAIQVEVHDLSQMEVYREAVRIAQLDHLFGGWTNSVTATPAASCGFSDSRRIVAGATTDLILFRGRSMTELMARPQSDRIVLRDGKRIDTTLPDFRLMDSIVGAP